MPTLTVDGIEVTVPGNSTVLQACEVLDVPRGSEVRGDGKSPRLASDAELRLVGGAALPLYVAGWLLIPEDGADQSIVGELFSSLENRSR